MSGLLRLDLLRRAALNALARHEGEFLLAALGSWPAAQTAHLRAQRLNRLRWALRAYVPPGSTLWRKLRWSGREYWVPVRVEFGQTAVVTAHVPPQDARVVVIRWRPAEFLEAVLSGELASASSFAALWPEEA